MDASSLVRARVRATTAKTIAFVLGLTACSGALAQNDLANYEYDALGRLIKVVYPDGGEKEYRYDPAGNREEQLTVAGGGSSSGGGPTPTDLRIEAEDMTSSPSSGGYRTESLSTASGGVVMNLKGGSANGHTATLSATFSGITGTYDVVLGYHDEQDGHATLTTTIDGQQLSSLVLNASGLGNQPSATNFMTSVLGSDIQVANGDLIEIVGVQGTWDHANIDYIEFVAAGGSTPSNQAPIVNAGSDQSITLPSSAALSGSASDDGQPTSAAPTTTWSMFSGPGTVSFGDLYSVNTTATFSLAGTYVLRLTANDGALSSTDDLTVIVSSAPSGGTRIEAESMTSSPSSGGYKTESVSTASGGVVMNLKGGAANGHTATLSATFSGSTGSYDIILGYHDEQDGDATLTTRIAGQQIDTFVLGMSGLGTQPSATNFMTKQVGTGVLVTNGDTVEITGVQGTWDHANIDYIEFVGAGSPPSNQAPTVNAGADQSVTFPSDATLSGSASDDGEPSPATLTTTWTVFSSPATATVGFSDNSSQSTTATFSEAGTYVLRLTASDGELSNTDDVTITVNAPSGGENRIEAEDMTSSPSSGGFRTDSVPTSSGGVVMNLKGAPSTGHTATLSATFTGDSGTYDIILGYHDENDGNSTLTTSVGGQQIDTFTLNFLGLGSEPTATNFRTREVGAAVQVTNGDAVAITGVQDNWDHTNVDYIEFVAVAGPPPVPEVTLSAANANEGGNVLFYVNLSESTTEDVSVDYVVDHPGGTNSASSNDYTASSGTLVIAAGNILGTVSVPTVNDSTAEQDELIRITLSNPVNATLTDTTRLGTIFDDDSSAAFWINDASVTEGGNLTFTVTKVGSTVLTHAVSYATASGTAAANDYTSASGTLSFAPSESSKTIIVPTTADIVVEPAETVLVNLSNPTAGATITDSQGVGTINNDDTVLQATNNSYSYLVDCCTPVPDKFLYPLGNDTGVNPRIISITQPPGSVTATLTSSSSIRLDINTTIYNGSMTYTITDDNGGTDTATIFITIEEND